MKGILPDNYYPLSVAADMAGYHPDYVYHLIRRGEVPYEQIRRRYYVDATVLCKRGERHRLPTIAIVREWLASNPVLERYPDTHLAEVATDELGRHVNSQTIGRAWRLLGVSKRRSLRSVRS